MKLDARQRWLVLGGLLTATLAAAAWVHDREDNDPVGVARAVDERSDAGERRVVRNAPPQRLAEQSSVAPGRSARGRSAQDAPQVRLDKLDARSLGDASKDPFALPRRTVKKRAAPKPAPVIVARPAPPPPPSAPPLPFRYMGKMMTGDGVSVFLIHGNRNLVVHEGDTIDSNYRIDRIADTAMTLTYLPLEQRQTLNFGERQ